MFLVVHEDPWASPLGRMCTVLVMTQHSVVNIRGNSDVVLAGFVTLQNVKEARHRPSIILNSSGDLAQLGERLHGMQEVTGSSPVISTSKSVPIHREGHGFAACHSKNARTLRQP